MLRSTGNAPALHRRKSNFECPRDWQTVAPVGSRCHGGQGYIAGVEYGVMTDADLLALAKEYFGFSHSPGSSAPTEPVTSLPKVFASALAEIKAKARITTLLPSGLPNGCRREIPGHR